MRPKTLVDETMDSRSAYLSNENYSGRPKSSLDKRTGERLAEKLPPLLKITKVYFDTSYIVRRNPRAPDTRGKVIDRRSSADTFLLETIPRARTVSPYPRAGIYR